MPSCLLRLEDGSGILRRDPGFAGTDSTSQGIDPDTAGGGTGSLGGDLDPKEQDWGSVSSVPDLLRLSPLVHCSQVR